MGTDIHGTIEMQLTHYGRTEWRVIASLDDLMLRSYGVFSYLFGVRGPCETGCAERGFPPDVAWSTRNIHKACSDNTTCHSATYITWSELKSHIEKVRAIVAEHAEWNEEWVLVLDLVEWLAGREPVQSDGERLRLVVWFDN
jgi:hypothetical protein